MDFDKLRTFVRVAELASFTRAADQLGMAKGRVSDAVNRLEADLGTRLLQRTTRSVHLTQDGLQFLERAKELLQEADELQAMFQPAGSGLKGRLRIDLSHALARDVVLPRLPEFLAAHPQLEVGISTTDRRVDLVREGFDCVMRVGTLTDSDLVVRRLGELPQINVASPAYLARHGTPQTLDELATHQVVYYDGKLGLQGAAWEYVDKGGAPRRLPMRASVVVNGTDAYHAACLAGLGMIQAPLLGMRRHVEAGTLVPVMPALTAPPLPVSLLYAHRRQMPPRVRAVLDWLTQVVSPHLAR
ncbi:MAG: LysR family transcriptional regulator [Aquabacterium sp.]|jgi:DNA-binding transcriptional LysR family regulator|uniref:LysR family transcriptional regulator n=1 Tax=Aquabacterium sp. TaxID=1872578 RepID=UPI003BB18154